MTDALLDQFWTHFSLPLSRSLLHCPTQTLSPPSKKLLLKQLQASIPAKNHDRFGLEMNSTIQVTRYFVC